MKGGDGLPGRTGVCVCVCVCVCTHALPLAHHLLLGDDPDEPLGVV